MEIRTQTNDRRWTLLGKDRFATDHEIKKRSGGRKLNRRRERKELLWLEVCNLIRGGSGRFLNIPSSAGRRCLLVTQPTDNVRVRSGWAVDLIKLSHSPSLDAYIRRPSFLFALCILLLHTPTQHTFTCLLSTYHTLTSQQVIHTDLTHHADLRKDP